MALSAKTNQLTGPASTGNSATTDPGFTPKALICFQGIQTAAGASASAEWGLGFSDDTTDTSAGYNSLDAAASSDVVRMLSTSSIIRMLTAGATTTNVVASVSTFDANGFTLNFATLVTTSPIFNYLALGGADISNVKVGTFASNTSTGDQAVTGIGFQPDIVLFFTQLQTAGGQSNNNSCYSFGVAKSSSARWTMGVGMQNAQTTMNNRRLFYDNACLVQSLATSDGTESVADFVSMDSDGFTINWSDAPSSGWLVGYLAIKGGQWKVGTETQKTSTGTKATTGVGFAPKGVMFGSHCDTTTNSVIATARLMFGVSTGASNNTCLWTGDTDNVADAVADTIMSATKCLVMGTEGTPTTNAEADIDSLDSDGFTLDWTTADGTARVFGYIAFGDNAGGGSTFTREQVDAIGVTDVRARVHSIDRRLNEALGLTDVLVGTETLVRALVDPLGITDVNAYAFVISALLNDAMGITDTNSRIGSYTRAQGETVGLTDLIVSIASMSRSVVDSMTLSDILTGSLVISVNMSDGLGITDTRNRVINYSRSNTDAEGIIDTINTTAQIFSAIVDMVGLNDSLERVRLVDAYVVDSVGLSDILAGGITTGLAELVDNLGITDTLGVYLVFRKQSVIRLDSVDDIKGSLDSVRNK